LLLHRLREELLSKMPDESKVSIIYRFFLHLIKLEIEIPEETILRALDCIFMLNGRVLVDNQGYNKLSRLYGKLDNSQ
jgi:hypothetical protein